MNLVRTKLARWSDLVGDLAIGAGCPGCARPSLRWCPDCRGAMRPVPAVESIGDLLVASAVDYVGVARASILAWKTSQRRDLHRGMVRLSGVSVAALLSHTPTAGDVTLVPVPTSRRSRRERGMRLVERLARDVARSWTSSNFGEPMIRAQRILSLVREPEDQAGLGADDRQHNLAGAMRCSTEARRSVILLDDIVTTGSTLAEAARAVTVAGGSVVGAAVVARVGRIPRNFAGK